MSTTIETTTPKSGSFGAAHSAFAQRCHDVPEWLKTLRQEALDRFMTHGLPSRRDEEWKYTSLRSLSEQPFAVPTDWAVFDGTRLQPHVNGKDMTLVFIDGVLSTAHSQLRDLGKGITVLSLADAMRDRAEAVSRLLTNVEPGTAQPFETLNRAFLQNGVFIEIAKDVQVERTIHLVYASSDRGERGLDGAPAAFPRNLISMAENSEAQVVETYFGDEPAAYLVSPSTDIDLAKGARLKHCKVIVDGPKGTHIGTMRARLASDAHFESFVHCQGGLLVRNDLDVAIRGEGAHVAIDGLYLAKDEQHVDNHTSVDHAVPNATSSQLYKGILNGKGRGVFNGKVFVRKDAQRTSALQLNRNLLLSSEAEIDTKPELQIDADDVKCSHGAAIGQLDADQIFYLQSRGIDRDRAVSVLSQAFADEVLLKLTMPDVRARLRQLTLGWFAP